MDKKVKKDSLKPNPRINQFIIECLFNKYFEEKDHSQMESKKEEVYGFPLSPCGEASHSRE